MSTLHPSHLLPTVCTTCNGSGKIAACAPRYGHNPHDCEGCATIDCDDCDGGFVFAEDDDE